MQNRVYLDWNATTPLRREARAAMAAAWDLGGNPSSVHAEGRQARALIEDAREAIARAVGAAARDLVFTSGGTEANALALTPSLRGRSRQPTESLIVSSIEHASVLAGGRFSSDQIAFLPVLRTGLVDLDALKAMLAERPSTLVSVMLANNETGAIQPIAEVAELVHAAGGLLHVDAVQVLGKIPFYINELRADLVSVSAHKIGGPTGVGALILGAHVEDLPALIRGGGQERGRRAGTENVPAIAGFGAAVKVAMATLEVDMRRVETLRNRLDATLRQTQGSVVVAEDTPRLPNTTLVAMPGLTAETAVIGFDLAGIAVSSGSACSSGKVQPSHVLQAMGFGPDLTKSAIRFSLGWETTESDINRAGETWRKLAGALVKGDETVLERF